MFSFPEVIFGDHDLQDHLRSKKGLRMESEHQNTYDLMIWHDHWFNILTFFRGNFWRVFKLKAVCQYQHIIYGLAENRKHVWLA